MGIKKNIFYLFLFLFWLFIVINYKIFFAFFYNLLWNYFYNIWNYSKSLVFHSKSNIYSSNESIFYNLWNDFYKNKDYDTAINFFTKPSKSKDKKLSISSFYNLANSFYKLWEKNDKKQKKIELWNKSLDIYKDLLDYREEKKIRENHDFIEKKLEGLINKNKSDNGSAIEKKEAKKGDFQKNRWDLSKNWKNKQKNLEWKKNEPWKNKWSLWENWQGDINNKTLKKSYPQENKSNLLEDWKNSKPKINTWKTIERQNIYKLYFWEDIDKISPQEQDEIKKYLDFLKFQQERNKLFFKN